MPKDTYCRMKTKHFEDLERVRRDQIKRMLVVDKEVPRAPSAHEHRLGRNEHPDVRNKFGLHDEIDPVTPGEGLNLAVMAGPGDTEGFSKEEEGEPGAGTTTGHRLACLTPKELQEIYDN